MRSGGAGRSGGGTWRRNRRAPSRPAWWGGADDGNGGSSGNQSAQIIRVRSVDLKIVTNAKAHHTDKFEKCYPRNDEGKALRVFRKAEGKNKSQILQYTHF